MTLTFLMINYHHQKERKEKRNVKNILFTFFHSNKIIEYMNGFVTACAFISYLDRLCQYVFNKYCS